LIKGHDEAERAGADATSIEQSAPAPKQTRRQSDELPAEGAVRAKLPQRQAPQLSAVADEPPEGADWINEIKFDGYRLLCWLEHGKVRVVTRSGLDWTDRLPAVARAVEGLRAETALVDGELVALDKQGASSFPALQAALSAGKDAMLHLFLFDLLHLDGWDLRACKLLDRKRVLSGLSDWDGLLRFSDHHVGEAATMQRDQWCRDTQNAMGGYGPHGTYVHLYVNGLYWGLYNIGEKGDASYAAHYLGGDSSEYDALNSDKLIDGDANAWNTMFTFANGGITTDTAYTNLSQYLDIPNFIDYMMFNFYGANGDWPWHNWNAARRRVPGSTFHFFSWDAEWTFGIGNGVTADLTGTSGGSPGILYSKLRAHPEFNRQFGDHVQKHLFNGGALTPGPAEARWSARQAEIDQAIICESARWGFGYTRQTWLAAEAAVHTWFPQRSAIFLSQLRAAGLYPHEKHYVHKYLPMSLGLFLGGVLLCQFAVIPQSISALLWFNDWLGFTPDLRLSEWLGFAILMPLVFGISFQTPIVMLLLERIGIMSVEGYIRGWRIAVFLLAVMAMIITPTPDAYTMILMWLPLCGLYFLGIYLCKLSGRHSERESEDSENEYVEV
jgi:hypothetical protein